MQLNLDRGAMVSILKSSGASAAVEDAAHEIGAALAYIDTHDREPDVVIETHEAKLSAAASVTLVHPGMEAIEHKHGYLAKAARAAGYKVK